MSLKHILGQNSHWQVNKKLAKEVGVEAALLLSEFIDCHDFYEKKGQLIDFENELYFYETSEKIEENTTLGYKTQKSCISILVQKGLIKIKLKGLPAKLHFTICEDNIWNLFKTSIAEKVKLVLPKGENLNSQKGETLINNIIIKTDNKEEIIKETPPQIFSESLSKEKNSSSERNENTGVAEVVEVSENELSSFEKFKNDNQILISDLCNFFAISEIRNFKSYSVMLRFLNDLNQKNQIETFKHQFENYKKTKQLSKSYTHGIFKFIGWDENREKFTDGVWNSCEWSQKLKQVNQANTNDTLLTQQIPVVKKPKFYNGENVY